MFSHLPHTFFQRRALSERETCWLAPAASCLSPAYPAAYETQYYLKSPTESTHTIAPRGSVYYKILWLYEPLSHWWDREWLKQRGGEGISGTTNLHFGAHPSGLLDCWWVLTVIPQHPEEINRRSIRKSIRVSFFVKKKSPREEGWSWLLTCSTLLWMRTYWIWESISLGETCVATLDAISSTLSGTKLPSVSYNNKQTKQTRKDQFSCLSFAFALSLKKRKGLSMCYWYTPSFTYV